MLFTPEEEENEQSNVESAGLRTPRSPYLDVRVLHRLERLEGGGRTQALQALGDVGDVKAPRPEENRPMRGNRTGGGVGLGHPASFI